MSAPCIPGCATCEANPEPVVVAVVPHVDIDLSKLADRYYSQEWGWGARFESDRLHERQCRALGSAVPDVAGNVADLRMGGVTRDELPGLIAFLTAVYTASDPDRVVPCDCATDGDSHEPWCAIVEAAERAS